MIEATTWTVIRTLQSLNLVAYLTMENLALRQQLVVLKRRQKRPQLKAADRVFWVVVSKLWSAWKDVLLIVQPDTVVRWQKQGFKLFWRHRCRGGKPGRRPIHPATIALVAKMCNANPLWGAPRIHGELLKLGLEISERSISEILRRHRPKQPSQTWKTFIKNHMHETFAADFMVVPTAQFRVLFAFIVMNNASRKVIHFNVTDHPCAEWTAQQMREAFPWDTAPRFLIRDRGLPYSGRFREVVQNMGIDEIITARRCPWQNGYMERLIGSVRRECLDHVIIWSKAHLRKVLKEYFAYYNEDRTHLGLGKETPVGRVTLRRLSSGSQLVELPRVGGLHHRYEWSNAA
ncbi:MAG TPA: integrase core domain-containing protein [Candidatus Hydrogenedentes bacterium]|nr:integrase core domain-containing protein [Candidatus Hydrogenedentota bacterium]